MLTFRSDLAKALKYSEEMSLLRKKDSVEALDTAEHIFSQNALRKSVYETALKHSAKSVNNSIDPLQLDKNSQIYVYESSARAGGALFPLLQAKPQRGKTLQ
jgi:hypothetical protein